MGRKLFCEINPVCYKISLRKEIIRRSFLNLLSSDKIAKCRDEKKEFPNIVKSHTSVLVRRLQGVDIRLQENKVTNIELACKRINGIIIKPNETFSFWTLIGNHTKKKGYKKGLVIMNRGKFGEDYGGGLCQMANMIHYLVLNSPLEVTEIHHHSDALFPDERRNVPFGTGTSVFYNRLDYRFKNTTDQNVQILVWIEDGLLCGELRSERPYSFRYKLLEEDHHYKKEKDGKYYRNSKVYRITIDRKSKKEVKKELILDNHSLVMYDYKYIPKEQIRNS